MSEEPSFGERFIHEGFIRKIKGGNAHQVNRILLETYIKCLNSYNINRQWKNHENFTILMSAMEAKRIDIVKYLLDEYSDKIDVNTQDKCGYTAIFYLVDVVNIKDENTKKYWREVSKKIIDKTENINHIGRDGMTAFMRLMAFTKLRSTLDNGLQNRSDMEIEIAMMMLEKGANINMISNVGINALEYACRLKYANYHVIEMLINNGAHITHETIRLARIHENVIYYSDSKKKNNYNIIDLLVNTMRRQYGSVINELPLPIAEEIIEHFFITD